MRTIFQYFIENEGEMRTFGTVAIDVFTVVIMPLNGISEEFAGSLYFFSDFGQIGEFERRTVFFYQVVHVNIIEEKPIISQTETILWKVECLRYKVVVGVFH